MLLNDSLCDRFRRQLRPYMHKRTANMDKLVIFSGAGMSQESGLPTFRGKDGLWESMDVEKVADRKAWYCGRRPDCRERRQAVLDFINPIRRRILECRPNEAHLIAARLEEKYEVTVITQNGDDFHQRAGSTRVIHLHGEALKNASTLRPYIPLDIDPSDPDIRIGDKAPDGSQIRPYVIFFNENLQYGIWKEAVKAVREADMMVIVGCSLLVFPAARMIEELREEASLVVIDPYECPLSAARPHRHIRLPATKGMKIIENELLENDDNEETGHTET